MTDAPYDYAEFQRRVLHKRLQRRRQRQAIATFAAISMLFTGGAVWFARAPGVQGELRGVAQPVSDLAPPVYAALPLPSAAAAAPLSADQASAMLAALPKASAVVGVGTAIAANRLEDRIALLDEQLNEAQFDGDTLASIHALHSERAQLVDSLVRVRYAEQLVAAVR